MYTARTGRELAVVAMTTWRGEFDHRGVGRQEIDDPQRRSDGRKGGAGSSVSDVDHSAAARVRIGGRGAAADESGVAARSWKPSGPT